MSGEFIGLLLLGGLLLLMALRVPIAIALAIAGFAGYASLDGLTSATFILSAIPGELVRGYSFTVIPLFVLMGTVASASGMAAELYEASRRLARPRASASLASATIGTCAMFGAICGSSIATAATMTRVAIPEMRRAGYADGFAAGTVAAGGTLGILIPPSVILIIYALLAEESVPDLFAAGLIPGLILTLLCVVVAKITARLRPEVAPSIQSDGSRASRLTGLLKTWKLLLIFGVSLGGIYAGWFSPTEAAAVGAGLTTLVAAITRTLSFRAFIRALDEAILTSAMLFFVFLGALMFARFIALTQLPVTFAAAITDLGLPAAFVILVLVAFYVGLGCVLETVSMILITVPVFLPLVVGLGYDPVWFGILVVVVAEMGLITPPVGLNIFVIRSQLPDISLTTIYRGVLPYLAASVGLTLLLILLPDLALWLPRIIGP
ncbi:MAG: TRAP transporter large permease [Gammaproteobacteria bacterium]|jgi:tripartite ATP-independent transporter DctM subunit